jgi:hypothetical protein
MSVVRQNIMAGIHGRECFSAEKQKERGRGRAGLPISFLRKYPQ